jgi:tetratricopeptide (TPR) repeat protein
VTVVKPCSLLLAIALATGCGAGSQAVQDTAYIEILRLNVTRVRNATQQTRTAIARSRGGPYESELYLRLAELLSEEARYHYRLAVEREQRADQAVHVPQVRLLKEQAIGIYERILRVTPDSPLSDRALFNMAFEHRELQNFDEMAATLRRLIEERPESPLRPHAHIMLGDYHLEQPDPNAARRQFTLATRGSSPVMRELGHYRLGWLAMSSTNCRRALVEFERTLQLSRRRWASEDADAGDENEDEDEGGEGDGEEDEAAPGRGADIAAAGDEPDSLVSGDIDVSRRALTDMAFCYTTEREPRGVLEFLRARSRDRATYVAALGRFARRYSVSSNPLGTTLVVRELLRLAPADGERLDNIRAFHSAIRTGEAWSSIGDDVRLMHAAMRRHLGRREVAEAEAERLTRELEEYSRDLLTRAQEALPEAGDARVAQALQIAAGYESHFLTFPEGEANLALRQNLVDTYTAAGRPFDAGQTAVRVAAELEEGDVQRDALYDAVVAFQEALGPEAPALPPSRRVAARGALRRAAAGLLAYDLEDDRTRRVKFAVALTLYDEGRYQEAIDRFTALAYEYPGTSEAEASVRLVLDSYNVLNDYLGLYHAGERFLGEGSPVGEALRAEVRGVVTQAEQRMLDEVSLQAAGDEGGDLSMLVAFAEEHPESELGERALLNAFVAARATGETEQLYDLGAAIAEAYPASEQLPGIVSTLGQIALSRFEGDRAVEFLDRAAAVNEGQRARLLGASGLLLEQLGRPDDALDRYRRALEAGTDAASRSEPLQRLARLLERRGELDALIQRVAPRVDEAPFEAVARLGLAQLAAGDTGAAEGTLQQVLNASGSATSEALARAHYGSAEILAQALASYPALEDFALIEEYVAIVDVVQQTFLNAARTGDPDVVPLAFARLAFVLRRAADRLAGLRLAELFEGEELTAVQGALGTRVQTLRQTAQEAIGACARQALDLPTMTPAARTCLTGEVVERAGLRLDPPPSASSGRPPEGVDELRARLSRNPEDLEALTSLGERYLEAGYAAGAVLVFQAAVERDGGPEAQNLLGLARAELGDTRGAMEAFARAADGGLEAGRQNLATLLRRSAGDAAAEAVLAHFEAGRAGGRRLPGGGS